jgi:hypothetical protein
VRVRRAEERARALLADRKANDYQEAPKPKAAPLQGLSDEDKEIEEAKIAAEAAGGSTDADESSVADAPESAVNMPRRVKR